jgi:hypothetical protein
MSTYEDLAEVAAVAGASPAGGYVIEDVAKRLKLLDDVASMHTADFRARLRHHLSSLGKPSDAAALDRAIVEGTKDLLAGLKGGG